MRTSSPGCALTPPGLNGPDQRGVVELVLVGVELGEVGECSVERGASRPQAASHTPFELSR